MELPVGFACNRLEGVDEVEGVLWGDWFSGCPVFPGVEGWDALWAVANRSGTAVQLSMIRKPQLSLNRRSSLYAAEVACWNGSRSAVTSASCVLASTAASVAAARSVRARLWVRQPASARCCFADRSAASALATAFFATLSFPSCRHDITLIGDSTVGDLRTPCSVEIAALQAAVLDQFVDCFDVRVRRRRGGALPRTVATELPRRSETVLASTPLSIIVVAA